MVETILESVSRKNGLCQGQFNTKLWTEKRIDIFIFSCDFYAGTFGKDLQIAECFISLYTSDWSYSDGRL